MAAVSMAEDNIYIYYIEHGRDPLQPSAAPIPWDSAASEDLKGPLSALGSSENIKRHKSKLTPTQTNPQVLKKNAV